MAIYTDINAVPKFTHDVIYADPAWKFASNSVAKPGRNPNRHYHTMTLDEICALPVASLGADDCALFMWITGPHLAIGTHLIVMAAWGFRPSGMGFTWIKLNKRAPSLFFTKRDIARGTGFTTAKNAEFVLIGKRGKSVRKTAGVHEVIISPKREHSRKPDETRDRIQRYAGTDAKILELFARVDWPGQDCWGDQVGKFQPMRGAE